MLTSDPILIRSMLLDREREARDDALARLARCCSAARGRIARVGDAIARFRRSVEPTTACC